MDSLASTVAPATGRVTVRITVVALDAPETDVVLSAAFQLFGPQDAVDVVLVLAGVDELTEEHGAAVQDRCLLLAPDPALLPEILLLGVTEAADLVAQADVTTGRDAAESARAVVLLTATAQAIWDDEPSPTVPAQAAAPSGPKVWPQVTRLQEELTVARRDVRSGRAIATGTRRPTVVLVFQHRSYWGAVATLCTELAARPEVDVEVVALDSTADGRTESTAAFLADRGIEARTAEWFLERMDDVDVVVLDNPYDEFRPVGLQVPQLVDAGIRVVSVPYGANAMGGEVMDRMLWDLPLQRSAWRAYVGSPTQESLFARHCASGAAHVRVLGTPKLDRLQQPASSDAARRWRTLADGRPVVLWNPHFRVEQGGWSTFDSYVGPLLERFTDDDRALLVVRPHFRLFADLRRLGAEGVKLERDVRSIVARSRNIVLDESPDYLDALLACDVMLSDMSSLVTELLPTGKPILYLRRADGPGLNEEGAHFAALEHADSWADVAGFLDRVLDGEDRAAEARAEVVRESFPLADGRAGERIAGDIVTGLLEELGERTPVLGRALSPAFLQSHYDGARSDRLDHAVLLSAYGGSVACSPRAIARELHRRGHDAQRWWVVRDPRQAVPAGCQPVLKDSAAHLELLSRARWVVDNEAMAWFLDKRPGQTFLQTWHGTPLKLLRWHLHEAVPRSLEYMKWADKEAGQWDVLVSASPLFSEIAADAFHTPARVLDTGYPRNDVLADPARRDATAAAVRRALSIPAGAKVVLHAPTYRDQVPGVAASSWVTPRVTDAAALAESLGPDTVVLQRVHRFTADLTRTSHPQVREVSDYPDSADLMALADLLVTDYSSSMFDFTATGRPIVLHVPDYEHYRDSLRGFYFPLDQVAPGPLTRSHEDLAVAVKERLAPGAAPDAGYTAFRERFAPWDDGHAAERVVDAVFA